MEKKGTKRSIIFLGLVGVFCYLSYILDKDMLFVYVPYWLALIVFLAILVPFLPRGPWIIKTTVLLFFSVWFLLVLPRVRSSELKEFYVDAWSIKTGMTIDHVDSIMAKYEKNPVIPISGALHEKKPVITFNGAKMVGVKESKSEHDSRILYLHKNHSADWCVVYPHDGRVKRVVIQPD